CPTRRLSPRPSGDVAPPADPRRRSLPHSWASSCVRGGCGTPPTCGLRWRRRRVRMPGTPPGTTPTWRRGPQTWTTRWASSSGSRNGTPTTRAWTRSSSASSTTRSPDRQARTGLPDRWPASSGARRAPLGPRSGTATPSAGLDVRLGVIVTDRSPLREGHPAQEGRGLVVALKPAHERLEAWPMVCLQQVRQLVDDDAVDHPARHAVEGRRQPDRAGRGTARAPSVLLVGHPRDGGRTGPTLQVGLRELARPRRQVRPLQALLGLRALKTRAESVDVPLLHLRAQPGRHQDHE